MTYGNEIVADFANQTFAYLEVVEQAHLLTITLNRAEKKNAMNPTLVNELAYALSYAHHQTEIWAVVLAAKGDVFCAGADLKAFMGGDDPKDSTIPTPKEQIIIGDLFRHLHKPCIARVHASVYAGGMLLLGGCTHVIAKDNVFFALPEVKRGLWPMQVMQSLLSIMPPRKVLDWCMRGHSLNAHEALDYGLATQLVQSDIELMSAVDLLVADLFKNSPNAIRMGLQAFDELQSKSSAEAHAYLHTMLMKTVQSQDAMEGIMAFREKRKPVWKNK